MVVMGMREQNVGVDRLSRFCQGVAEFTHSGAGIEDDEAAAASHFDTGRVAAITLRGRSRTRDRAAHSPKTDAEF